MVNKGIVCGFWQSPTSEFQYKTLRYCLKSYSFFSRKLVPLSFWKSDSHLPLNLNRVNPWTWATRLPWDLSVYHVFYVLVSPKAGHAQQYSIIIWKRYARSDLIRSWKYKEGAWVSGTDAHDPYFCSTVLFLSASTYDCIGNSPHSREDLNQVDRLFGMKFGCHSKVDSFSTVAAFWDNLEGQWWRKILEVDRI